MEKNGETVRNHATKNHRSISSNMNNEPSQKPSETDWARIDAMADEDIDFSDIPEITEAQIARATPRFGGVNWWQKVTGTFPDDEATATAEQLGREWRKSYQDNFEP
jgi:hypothetical protein